MRIRDWSSDVCSSDLLVAPVLRQPQGHEPAPQQGVRRAPGLGLVAQDLELQRQRTGALGEEGVDAFRIGLQGRLGFAGEVLEIGLGELAEAEGAEKAIEAQRRLPHHLGEAAGGGAAHEIHLPQALLGMDEAERAVEVVRSEEHTSELQSLMRISYAVFCLKQKTTEATIPVT